MARVNRPHAPDKGLGWLAEYVCRLVKTYGFTRTYVMDELAMIEGWMWYAFAIEDDAMNKFGGIRPVSQTYLEQESEKLISQAKKVWGIK